MPDRARSYLLVPAAGAGEGVGHLARCLRLAGQLHPRVTILTSRMDSAARALLAQERERFPARPRPRIIARPAASETWDVIVIDARRTTRGELDALMGHGPVLCLDEGGEARDHAPFVVDALPGLPGASPANLSSPAFLDLPPRQRRRPPAVPRRVLVSFGGEDRANLTGRLVDALLRKGVFAPDQITVVEGPLFAAREWPEGVEVRKGESGLAGALRGTDLLFTHFGISAFEALATGVPVVLLSPTPYHARLAASAGIPGIGVGVPDMGRLAAILRTPQKLASCVEAFNADVGRDREHRLARLLKDFTAHGSASCPVCGADGNVVIARFPDRSYRRCRRCGIVYLQSFLSERKSYGDAYFSTEYRAQYGRTYLEDFDAIKAASRPRVAALRELMGPDADGAVVDIGCAYGPFLEALKERDMPGYGLDVSASAVAYVRKKLGMPAVRAAFENVGRSALPRRISAVTLWYVIEHFVDADRVLRKASALLPPGGVLAFSTPNGRGVSARRSLQAFLEKSPGDHFTIFSPRGLRRILARYGLELRRIRVTGHHPERFPGLLGRAAGKTAVGRRLLLVASRLLGLGDTFEVYAVKGE